MARIISSPSIKTQWGLAQMRQLASSGENNMSKPSGIDIATVKQMLLEGKTNEQIAEHYGIAVVSVRNFRQKNGLNQAKIAEMKQEDPAIPEVNDTQAAQQEEQDTPAALENTQALPEEEHNTANDIDNLDDWITTPTIATVGQRIDIILSQLRPSDCETVRKTFGLLCGRIISEHIGL